MDLNQNTLEVVALLIHDTKKVVRYNKNTDKWSWANKDEQDNVDAYHGAFPTFWEAACDAVDPYI